MTSKTFTAVPENWTLRFKHAKSTLFLHINPDQSFSTIKTALHNSIKVLPVESQLIQSFGGVVPSSDANDIVLGLQADKTRPEDGWIALDPASGPNDASFMETDEEDKLSRKRVKKESGSSENVLNRSPRSVGLKDGKMLAFTYRSLLHDGKMPDADGWGVELPKQDDDDEEMEDEK